MNIFSYLKTEIIAVLNMDMYRVTTVRLQFLHAEETHNCGNLFSSLPTNFVP